MNIPDWHRNAENILRGINLLAHFYKKEENLYWFEIQHHTEGKQTARMMDKLYEWEQELTNPGLSSVYYQV
jgi:hypothetical protein